MRLWHYKLIPYLPKSQIISQWREIICIAKNLKENGTPNHILVNRMLNYDIKDFNIFCNKVVSEMLFRKYKISESSICKLENYINFQVNSEEKNMECFINWHNDEYLTICYYNLKEKYCCGQKDFFDDIWNNLECFYRGEII